MLNTIFQSIINSETGVTAPIFIECIFVALIVGAFLAFSYSFKSKYTKSFILTLILLPAIVSTVIMMVNGNIGAGVAVAGAFSLVRFRSIPGTAKEICSIFMAMGTGLVIGMGYIGYAILFAIILGISLIIFNVLSTKNTTNNSKSLKITIPEDLNYYDVFDEVFKEFTSSYELISCKSTNMGSLFKLKYSITLKDPSSEKDFIDSLRCKNGNLEISIGREEMNNYEL